MYNPVSSIEELKNSKKMEKLYSFNIAHLVWKYLLTHGKEKSSIRRKWFKYYIQPKAYKVE